VQHFFQRGGCEESEKGEFFKGEPLLREELDMGKTEGGV